MTASVKLYELDFEVTFRKRLYVWGKDDDDTDMMQRKHDCYYLIYEFFKEVMEG